VIAREHVAIKKPGTGLPPDRLEEIIGRRLARRVTADQVLAAEDIEGFA
jgi:N,N'-diacetyllegionaminate synthase